MSDQYVKLEEERRQKERAEKKKREKKKRKEKHSGRGKRHDSGPESEEDITPTHMVDIVTEEMPEVLVVQSSPRPYRGTPLSLRISICCEHLHTLKDGNVRNLALTCHV